MSRSKATLDVRSPLFTASLYVAFFASGASSLFAEVTWNRMLIVVVGNSMSATAMITVVFMGGLGLGSYLAGRIVGRRRPSLVPYLLLEVAIGLYILGSPALFDVLSGVFSAAAAHAGNRVALTFVRVVVSLAALLLPALLMGATFPAMISGAAPDSPSRRTGRTGFLYSVNTLGAAVGCFVAGYHLLFEYGVRTTLAVAFCLNLVAASFALVANLSRRAAGAAEEPPVPARRPEAVATAAPPAPRRFLEVATFAIGFVALAYEVLLTRLGILFLGNVASVFALVLTGFLLGTGISAVLGTWAYGALARRTPHAGKLFGVVALASGALVVMTPYYLLSAGGVEFAARAAQLPAKVLLIIIGPTIFLGALLPVAIRMLQRQERADSTKEAANLYALNTAGGLLGAGVVNHLLVPTIGAQGVLIGLASICAAVGIVSLLAPDRDSLPRWAVAGAAALSVPVLLAGALPRMTELYGRKLADSTHARFAAVRLLKEGRAANVTVLDVADPTVGTYRDMYLNGIEEASTRYWHTQLFKLLGTLPVMAHASDSPKDALVIAFGAGITAGSVLTSDEIRSLDVVDLNPDVEGINDLFADVNGDVFHQPRFHFHVDDGRNYLVTTGKQYDVIISDSTHPRAYDSWILYTQEFYRSVRSRLRADGVFAQWVPVDRSMRGELFRIHLNTFRSVFPHATLWYVYGSDQAFLLATPRALALDAKRLERKLDRLPAWYKAQHYQIDSVTRLGGFFWLDEPSMAQMIATETRLNTDDRHYFDKQSAVAPVPPALRLPRFQASVLPWLQHADDTLVGGIRAEQEIAQRVARFGFYDSGTDLAMAYCSAQGSGNGIVRYYLARAYAEQVPDDLCQELRQAIYRQ